MEYIQVVSNIVLSALSVLLAALSMVFIVLTLRQNNRLIEESTRPYIGVSFLNLNNGTPIYEIVVKNYGQSAGKITHFETDVDLRKYVLGHAGLPLFEGIEGMSLMPGQALISAVDYTGLRANNIDLITFHLSYAGPAGVYSECCEVGVAVNANLVQGRCSTDGAEMKTISYSLQTITERLV